MNGQVELSKRMQAVANMVTEGNRVCDVGCDHGYVSIYLLQSGISPKVLAMDVNKGPLLRAKEHVRKYQVEDYIELRLSDGLTAYQKGEADTLLCAGMGGRLLMGILEKEPDKTADFKELVLQPQSELKLFRKFLREKGYILLKEDMILEDGKFYPMMKVTLPTENNRMLQISKTEEETDMEDLLGPLLLQEQNDVLLQYIKQEISLKEGILEELINREQTEKIQRRRQEIKKELLLLNKAVKRCYEGRQIW